MNKKSFKLDLKKKITIFFPEDMDKELQKPLNPFRIEQKDSFRKSHEILYSGKNCPFCEAGIPKKEKIIIKGKFRKI